ncbi:MAG: gamma-glutamyltransferase [Alphaproteobacteria bacterium]
MIVTANPHATKAGFDILKRGGSAADAAIAAQLVLGLVEPQSSGLGGGAFVLYYDAVNKRLESIDARETAPGLAGPFLFYEGGRIMEFKAAQLSGKSVGVPGVPKLLEYLHQAHGTITWMELFNPARTLAREGFKISPRLAAMIENHQEDLRKNPESAAYFLDAEGKARPAGSVLKNQLYEQTLDKLAFSGSGPFYAGGIAGDIVRAVQNARTGAGFLTLQDLQGYTLKKRKPLCAPYHAYIVCSMGEPSSGGLTLLRILGLLEPFDLANLGPANPRSWSLIGQASALGFADRNTYMADPDFVNTPGTALLDPLYLEERRKLLNPQSPLSEVQAGQPPLWEGPLYATSNTIDKPGTSHISVIDKEGNIVSMTTTIESAFGAHIMTNGFLLNNELTDFSFKPFDERENLVANMVEGGKRPRSSMAPTIVFDLEGEPVLIIGSAGGSRIIGYVLQRLISVLDWEMPIEDAIAAPHILARSPAVEMENGVDSELYEGLKRWGFEVNQNDLNSGLTAIYRRGGVYTGAADPRREGTAMGN